MVPFQYIQNRIRTWPSLEDVVCTRLHDRHHTILTAVARHDDLNTRKVTTPRAVEDVLTDLNLRLDWLEAFFVEQPL